MGSPIGSLPDSVQRAIRDQHPGLMSKPGSLKRRPKPEPENNLPVHNHSLKLWFPEMKLPSVNMMIGSNRRETQPEAKNQALEAFENYKGQLWQFTVRVDITVHQLYAPGVRSMDPDNLYSKHLIDMLTKSGVIKDDSMRFVHSVKRVVDPSTMTGVELIIEPYATPQYEFVGGTK